MSSPLQPDQSQSIAESQGTVEESAPQEPVIHRSLSDAAAQGPIVHESLDTDTTFSGPAITHDQDNADRDRTDAGELGSSNAWIPFVPMGEAGPAFGAHLQNDVKPVGD